jgi:hypothetical protein
VAVSKGDGKRGEGDRETLASPRQSSRYLKPGLFASLSLPPSLPSFFARLSSVTRVARETWPA